MPGLENAKFCQVACASNMTLALTRHGTLYSFGCKDTEGILGRDNFVRWPNYQANVVSTLYYHPIQEIAVGERHCIVRTRYNKVYGWGKNNHGQLGLGNTDTKTTPTEIIALNNTKLIQIQCGGSHTTVLTTNGKVWCFGNNNYGQCGVELNLFFFSFFFKFVFRIFLCNYIITKLCVFVSVQRQKSSC